MLTALPPTHSSVTKHITSSLEEIVNNLSGLFGTRREILRYINQVQFMLSTLYAEVNISDLCLLEAIKLFHPAGYTAIQRKRGEILHDGIEFVIQSIRDNNKPEEMEKRRNALLESIMLGCPKEHTTQIQRIVTDQLLHKYFQEHSLSSNKRMNDPNYFDKYFVGCAPDNTISDQMLYQLSDQISDTEYKKNAHMLNTYLNEYGWNEFCRAVLFMINLEKDKHIRNSTAQKIAISMSLMQFEGHVLSRWTVPTLLCGHVINLMFLPVDNPGDDVKRDEEMIFKTCETIITNAPLDFIAPFASTLYKHVSIANQRNIGLVKQGVDRIISEQGEDALLNLNKYDKVRLLAVWAETNMAELELLIARKVSEFEFNVIDFLEGFVEESTERGNNYSWIDKIFHHNKPIYDAIYAKVPEDQIKSNTTIQAFLKSYNTTRISIRDIARQRRKQ
jgi:hypothetical protein